MSRKRIEYLSYIEETKKHHPKLNNVARVAAKEAIQKARNQSIPITYLAGEEIIKESAEGREVIGKHANHRRKVKIGSKSTLS